MNFHDLIDHMYGRIQGRGPTETMTKQKKILKTKSPSIVETEPLVEPTFGELRREANEQKSRINEYNDLVVEYNKMEKGEEKKKQKKVINELSDIIEEEEEKTDPELFKKLQKKRDIDLTEQIMKNREMIEKRKSMGAMKEVMGTMVEKKKQKLYRAYKKKITEFMEPYKSMKQMMFLQKQEYEESGKFNNMTEEEKREIKRDGKFFELLLDRPLKYVIYMITGDRGTITNNDTNEKIRKDLRMYAVFDLSQKTADIECKCFVCNAYNRSSTGEIVLQKSKIEGNIGFKPYYIVVDGEVKLYNVWNERESKWVNKDFYKDTYVVFLLTDGIYKFNIIDYDGFEIGNEATVGGVEDLFTLKSKIPYVKKDFEGTKQEVVVLDNSKLIKIY